MTDVTVTNRETIWAQKYRPSKIEECILPEYIKELFIGIRDKGEIPHLLLSSNTPGTGKTTVALALCEELDMDYLMINSSEDNGIDVARTKIRQFASTMSLTGGKKVVILDEFDLATEPMQKALRGQLEEFSSSCSFIFTANFKKQIIEPIVSRCVSIDFVVDKEETPKLMSQMFKRSCQILDMENIEYDKKVIVEVIKKFYPDNRSVLTKLQEYSTTSGSIDEGILAKLKTADVETLIAHIKGKDFAGMRQWLADNKDQLQGDFYEKLYNSMYARIQNDSKLEGLIIIADYQRTHGQAASSEIHIAAMMAELMGTLRFL